MDEFPDVSTRTPYTEILVPEVKFYSSTWSGLGLVDDFAVILTGMLAVYTEGTYEFSTASDDGSELYVNGIHVVQNSGLHGTEKRYGSMMLTEGLHFIMVTYFERGGGAELFVKYRGPDTKNVEQYIEEVYV